MKLNNVEFKRFKELQSLIKSGKATEADKAEFAELQAKRNDKGSNAIEWWKNYPALLSDVVNIPFNYIPGTPFPITAEDANQTNVFFGVLAVATIRPAIGRSLNDNSAFNAQVRQLWLDMHRKYRGIGTYEKSDLGMMIIAVNSVFSSLAKFERIYGVINTYHIGNRVVPYALKEALRIDDSLETNLADFRYQLNLAITKLQQLCLPKGLAVLQSDVITLSNIFKDSANRRASLFLFDTDVYGVYNTSLTDGGCVQFKFLESSMTGHTPAGEGAFTLTDIVGIINEQMNALLGDDDIARMCSDLIAAYGPENVAQLTTIPTDYKVEPVEDYERQLQFHNLTVCPGAQGIYDSDVIDLATAQANKATTYNVIYQKGNVVRCELGIGGNDYYQSGTKIIPVRTGSNIPLAKNGDVIFDTWVEKPGEVEIMCGTRYTTIAGTAVSAGGGKAQELVAFGTQVCTLLEVYHYQVSTGTYQLSSFTGSVIQPAKMNTTWGGLAKLQQIDWHPLFYVWEADHYVVFGDIDNCARINYDALARLHEVALLSGYKIPMVSKD